MEGGGNVALMGEGGTGKTYLLSKYIAWRLATPKNGRQCHVAVCASTGIAASHLEGQTIHSWSGIGMLGDTITRADIRQIARRDKVSDRISAADVLIIDEVSMISGRTLNAVNEVCKEVRDREGRGLAIAEPFGGLQVILVGDFFQLPPIMRVMMEFGESPYAFASDAWAELDPAICYLTEPYRQSDPDFLGLLQDIRANRCPKNHPILHRRLIKERVPDAVTRLYTHRADVDMINRKKLRELPGEVKTFHMTSDGDNALIGQLKRNCLSPEILELKDDAIVMFTQNDTKEHQYVNGTLGVMTGFADRTGFPRVRKAQRR